MLRPLPEDAHLPPRYRDATGGASAYASEERCREATAGAKHGACFHDERREIRDFMNLRKRRTSTVMSEVIAGSFIPLTLMEGDALHYASLAL